MTNQEKKHFLSQYLKIREEYQRQLDRYRELRSTFDSVKAQIIDDMPKGSKETYDKTGENLARIEELEVKNTALIKQYMAIEEAINSLDDTVLRQLMRLRYIDGNTFESIAVALEFSFRHVLRLHGKALTKIVIKSH